MDRMPSSALRVIADQESLQLFFAIVTKNRIGSKDLRDTNPSYLNPGIKAPFEIILLSASVPVKQINNYTLAVIYQ